MISVARHVVVVSTATMIVAAAAGVGTGDMAAEVVVATMIPTAADLATTIVSVVLTDVAMTMVLEALIAMLPEVVMTVTAAVEMTIEAAVTTANATAMEDVVTGMRLLGKLVNPMLEVETKITVMIGTPAGRCLR